MILQIVGFKDSGKTTLLQTIYYIFKISRLSHCDD